MTFSRSHSRSAGRRELKPKPRIYGLPLAQGNSSLVAGSVEDMDHIHPKDTLPSLSTDLQISLTLCSEKVGNCLILPEDDSSEAWSLSKPALEI